MEQKEEEKDTFLDSSIEEYKKMGIKVHEGPLPPKPPITFVDMANAFLTELSKPKEEKSKEEKK